jgi:multidrug efflux pump subunit AcrB
MNLVRLALRRPLTVLVLIVGVVAGAFLALGRMAQDIFPPLGVPTIYVAQPFGGMDPAQMEGYLTYYYEYHFLYITGIEHVESKSVQGAALIKLQFHPGTDMPQAMAETVAYVNRARAFMPPGTVPPFVMRFDAGSVPVGNLVFSSDTRSVGEMQDMALNRVRPLFATLPGVSAPPPFGGSARSIVVSVRPERLRAYQMSPDEIVSAIAASNAISPSGNVTLGDRYPMVPVNSVVRNIKDLEAVPIRAGTDPSVFVRDVAEVQDASDIVTCYALVNGRRTVYIPVTKRADASTLAVVDRVKRNLPRFQAALPEDVRVSYEFDQSPFVTRAIAGLTLEGALGALLAGVVVLLFLRDLRSALVVVINIPLSLLAAVLALWLTGQTINLMTLGGLALAVGILVDMSTVVIENVHTHLGRGQRVARAVADSSHEVALPLLIAMLCVLAVFLPSFFMEGAARALFVPLALAVGFSMVASYLLASSFVPVVCVWLLRAPAKAGGHDAQDDSQGLLQRSYGRVVRLAVAQRWAVAAAYLVLAAGVAVVAGRFLGTEIFPQVDTGQLRLRLRAPAGTKVERTEALALQVLELIKQEAGASNVALTLGFVGVHAPSYPINLVYEWNGGPHEGVLQVQLASGARLRADELKERLRARLAKEMPDVRFSFEPSDIVGRMMSFGSATPVEVAVSGPSLAADSEFAQKIQQKLAAIPVLRDVQLGQSLDYPTLDVVVDRERAGLLGVKTTDVARSLVAATSSSRFTQPVYWADPNSGVAYQVQVQVPQREMSSLEDVQNIPILRRAGQSILLRSVASVAQGTAVGEYDRYNMQRLVTVTANVQGADLGRAASLVQGAIQSLGEPPPRVSVAVRGQVVPMTEMMDGLRRGLLLSIGVIFLLLTANFQSLRLSAVVVSTLPGVIAGIALMLAVTGTRLSLESFMGSVMAIGVAVANAILVVSFAERSRVSGMVAADAAVDGARSRLRPVLMTSLAMIAGMLPMALGLGEGGEQTAPLGRAVIGGLAAATLATLFVLPAVFAIASGRAGVRSSSLDPEDPSSAHYAPAAD